MISGGRTAVTLDEVREDQQSADLLRLAPDRWTVLDQIKIHQLSDQLRRVGRSELDLFLARHARVGRLHCAWDGALIQRDDDGTVGH